VRLDRVWEIARKDIQSVVKHKYVLYGLIGIPLLFAAVIPLASIYPLIAEGAPQEIVLKAVEGTILMFLLLPAITPSTIASYTLVGEKVNRQLEPLLATPTTDFELLLGKGLGAFVPAIAMTFVSFAGFVVVVNLLTFELFGRFLLPNLFSAIVLLIYTPLICIFSISWCVFVSSKVSDVRAAIQLGVVTMMPVIAFYIFFAAGFVALDWVVLVGFALALTAASVGLFSLSKATFQREEILTRWK